MSYKNDLQGNNTDLQTILSKVNALPSGSALGDATAADVVAGKTFSSASGLKVVGTMIPPEVETGSIVSSGANKMTIPNLSKFNNAFVALMPPVGRTEYTSNCIITIHKTGSTIKETYAQSNAAYTVTDLITINGDTFNVSGLSFCQWDYTYVLYN